MVQAIENLTWISGEMIARKPHPRLGEYDIVTLRVARADAVEGKANLLATHVGGEVELAVRRELLGSAPLQSELRCRAKFTPDGPMCEPHPEPSAFAIVPP